MKSKPVHIDWTAVLIVLSVASMLATLSVLRFNGYNSGMFDIGNMSQAIWSATQGYPLEFTWQDGNVSRLSWHVEIIYSVLAGLYALFPDPRTLLVFQAVLSSVGALPAYRMASRRFSNRNYVRALMLVYLLYPTANTAVLFDFHGDTLAMPLLMFALNALDARAWRRYWLWLVLALLCKFYVAVAVLALGVVLCLEKRCRIGTATLLIGGFWLAVTMVVVRPAFSPQMVTELNGGFGSYVQFYFTGSGSELILNTLQLRVATAFLVLMPALLFGRYALKWFLPSLAIALPALLSIGEGAAYDYRFHHYAIPVPFFFVAVLYGIDAHRHRQLRVPSKPVRLRNDILLQCGIMILFFVLLVDTPLNPQFWFTKAGHWGINDTKYGQTSRDRFKDSWLAAYVPESVPIATTGLLAPHLINRRTIYMLRYSGEADEQQRLFLQHLEEVDHVVADALFDFAVDVGDGNIVGGVLYNLPGISDTIEHPEFALESAQDGLLLFSRTTGVFQDLKQDLVVTEVGSYGEPVARFDDRIVLWAASAEELGAGRYRLRFAWEALQPLENSPQLLAVSRISGVEHSRYPHLPVTVTYPTSEWRPGQLVVEEFDIVLPDGIQPGTHKLLTGWYDTTVPEANATDTRSRVGEEIPTLTLSH